MQSNSARRKLVVLRVAMSFCPCALHSGVAGDSHRREGQVGVGLEVRGRLLVEADKRQGYNEQNGIHHSNPRVWLGMVTISTS